MEEERVRWGTWEELLLGGAVLRHGTLEWEAVASELQTRILRPHRFTSKECKSKYEDLQERYSSSSAAWFEELRKRRVAELKRELEESEDSIGSLKSKLRGLIGERRDAGSDDLEASLNIPATNIDSVESAEESTQFWSAREGEEGEEEETEAQRTVEIKVVEGGIITRETLQTISEKSTSFRIGQACVRKRRGERKRKASASVVREASTGESDLMSSAAAAAADGGGKINGGEESCVDYDRSIKASGDGCSGERNYPETNLEALLGSVMEDENVSIFRRRSAIQRTAKYKRCIRRHVDFGTLRSGIRDGSVHSTMELYRDLLLLSSNAIAFYPKNSPEYHSALALRDLPVLRRLRQGSTSSASGDGCQRLCNDTTTSVSGDHVSGDTAKKRSRRPYENRRTRTMGKTQNAGTPPTKTQKTVVFSEGSPSVDPKSPPPLPPPQPCRKRGVGRPKQDSLPKGRKKQRR